VNRLRDFRLFRWQHGPQRGQESIWLFRFAKCDDFARVLGALNGLPQDARYYYREEEVWAVKPAPDAERLLAWLFDNFKAELALARRQPELPVLAQMPIERRLPWMAQGRG
jgi:hypothetical protein